MMLSHQKAARRDRVLWLIDQLLLGTFDGFCFCRIGKRAKIIFWAVLAQLFYYHPSENYEPMFEALKLGFAHSVTEDNWNLKNFVTFFVNAAVDFNLDVKAFRFWLKILYGLIPYGALTAYGSPHINSI